MEAADKVLTRKLSRRGVARSPLPDTDFLGQTFAREIEKELRPLVKATISAMVLESKIMKISDALQGVSVPALLGLVEIESAKVQGLLNMDTELVFHLIDLMLGGDPAVSPVSITRSFTSIDMAVGRLPQDSVIAAFVGALSSCFGRPLRKRISVVGQRQDITQVRIAPENVDVLMYTVALDIGEAARSGTLQFFLPLATLDVISAAMREEVAEVEDEETVDLWKVQMRRAAATAPVVIKAVLHKQRMTIAALESLKPGDILDIPPSAVDEIQLLIAQPGGKDGELATGRLGAFQGFKVVKLATSIDQRFQDQIRRLL